MISRTATMGYLYLTSAYALSDVGASPRRVFFATNSLASTIISGTVPRELYALKQVLLRRPAKSEALHYSGRKN